MNLNPVFSAKEKTARLLADSSSANGPRGQSFDQTDWGNDSEKGFPIRRTLNETKRKQHIIVYVTDAVLRLDTRTFLVSELIINITAMLTISATIPVFKSFTA